MSRPLWIAALLVLAAGGAACGSSDDGDAACGPILREALDSAYLVHVLGTDTDVEYASDPPTSGPHQPSPPADGALDEPLTRPIQVGILERGDVLIQYQPSLPATDVESLVALAGDGVVVAPNPDLDDPVVATAWVHKRSCDAVDTAALQTFIDERVGQGPED
ncbi:MAG: DUF3105 domain-containing protein [Actinomycetota bacterium]